MQENITTVESTVDENTAKFVRPLISKRFWIDLYNEIDQDQVSNGAAALSYYFFLSIFPALIFLMSILPYLPVANLSTDTMKLISGLLPPSAAEALRTTVVEITTQKKQGLISFGALLTLWSASAGIYAIMQQLDITYDVKETRPFWKVRGISILLTIAFGIFFISSFTLIVLGGAFQNWLNTTYVLNPVIPVVLQFARWVLIIALATTGFAILYSFGPNVKSKFRLITPGAIFGVGGLISVSMLLRLYVENFSDYSASYGSLGAVIVMLLWFYLAGHVILIGSEINALVESGPIKKQSTV